MIMAVVLLCLTQVTPENASWIEAATRGQKALMQWRTDHRTVRIEKVPAQLSTRTSDDSRKRCVVTRKPGWFCAKMTHPNGFSQLVAANERYAFALDQSAPNQPWKATGVDLSRSAIPMLLTKVVGNDLDPEATLFEMPLHELLADSRLEISDLAMRDGNLHIQGKYRGTISEPGLPSVPYTVSVEMTLDSHNLFSMRSATLRYNESGNTIKIVNTFSSEPMDGGYRPCVRHVREVLRKGEWSVDGEVMLAYDVGNTFSEERCKLSYYGLPEPFGVEWEKPTPWWLYIGGGTLGVLAVAALGYRLLSRRAA